MGNKYYTITYWTQILSIKNHLTIYQGATSIRVVPSFNTALTPKILSSYVPAWQSKFDIHHRDLDKRKSANIQLSCLEEAANWIQMILCLEEAYTQLSWFSNNQQHNELILYYLFLWWWPLLIILLSFIFEKFYSPIHLIHFWKIDSRKFEWTA